jgi:hypothetical protein
MILSPVRELNALEEELVASSLSAPRTHDTEGSQLCCSDGPLIRYNLPCNK